MKLIKHYGTWCAPCRQLSVVMKEVNLPEGMELIENDIDKNQELAMKHGIRGVPTLVIEDDQGNVLRTLVGMHPATKLQAFINGE